MLNFPKGYTSVDFFFLVSGFFLYKTCNFHRIFVFLHRNMKEKKKITFIINPISGTHSKEELPQIIETVLDPEQFNPELRFTIKGRTSWWL